MTKNDIKFSFDTIIECLFLDTPPVVKIYPFLKSNVQFLSLTDFEMQLSSKILEDTSLSTVSKLIKITKSIRNIKLKESDINDYFNTCTAPLLNLIFAHVVMEYIKWRKYYTSNILSFIESNESKFQWEIAKSIGIDSIMPNKPHSFEQKLWIVCASSSSKRDEQKFFVELVESIKPWMNIELYKNIENMKKNKRDNVLFEQQKISMLKGSFGLPNEDRQIIERIERNEVISNTTENNTEEDLDIIS